jgi:hypothetical protein
MKPTIYKIFVLALLVFLAALLFMNLNNNRESDVIEQQDSGETVFEKEIIETSQPVFGLPSIPVYPKAAFVETKANIEGEDYLYRSNWEINETVPKVMSWYVDQLSAGEWEIEKFPSDTGMEGKQTTIISNDEWRIVIDITQEDVEMLTQIHSKFYNKW